MECNDKTKHLKQMITSVGGDVILSFKIPSKLQTDKKIELNGQVFQHFFPSESNAFPYKEIILSLYGGRGFNLNSNESSDTDLKLVIIVDPRKFMGMDADKYKNFSAHESEQDKSISIDCNTTDLGEFIYQIIDGVPNAWDVLYTDAILNSNEYGNELLSIKDELKNALILKRLKGYINQNMDDVVRGTKSENEYPHKIAHHVLRAYRVMIDTAKNGEYNVVQRGTWAEFLKDVKYGRISLSDFKKTLLALESEWNEVKDEIYLQKSSDKELAVVLLKTLRQNFLSELLSDKTDKVILPNSSEKIINSDGDTLEVYIADGNDVLAYPLLDFQKKSNRRMEVSQFFKDIQDGNMNTILALYEPSNQKMFQKSTIGQYIYSNSQKLLSDSFIQSVLPFSNHLMEKYDSKRSTFDDKKIYIQLVHRVLLTASSLENQRVPSMNEWNIVITESNIHKELSKIKQRLTEFKKGNHSFFKPINYEKRDEVNKSLIELRLSHL